jgi:DNA-binding NarL/FixJ family response regulator
MGLAGGGVLENLHLGACAPGANAAEFVHQYVKTSDFYPVQAVPDHSTRWPGFFRGQQDVPVRVLLVDDDPHIRNVIVQDLLSDIRIDVAGQASSIKEARRLMLGLHFDVLLLDLNLGDGSGFELIAECIARFPTLEIVIVSCIDDESNVMRAFSMGATGYVVKSSLFGNFSQVVLQVVNGGSPISPHLARKLLKLLSSTKPEVEAETPLKSISNLSRRETEILKLVAWGHTSCEISLRLEISVQTVSSHVKNVYRKLHIHSRKEAASFLSRVGFS